MNYDEKCQLLIIGDATVGKTSILTRFTDDKFSTNYLNTVGLDFFSKDEVFNNKKVRIKIWDTAGQERFRSIQKHYYNKVDGILFIYDITNQASFDIIEQWYNEVKNYNDNIIGVLIGNKTDLEENRQISEEQGIILAKKLNFIFYECNSVDGENVDEAFESLVKMILEEKNKNKNKQNDIAIKIEGQNFSEQRQNKIGQEGEDRERPCVC